MNFQFAIAMKGIVASVWQNCKKKPHLWSKQGCLKEKAVGLTIGMDYVLWTGQILLAGIDLLTGTKK